MGILTGLAAGPECTTMGKAVRRRQRHDAPGAPGDGSAIIGLMCAVPCIVPAAVAGLFAAAIGGVAASKRKRAEVIPPPLYSN